MLWLEMVLWGWALCFLLVLAALFWMIYPGKRLMMRNVLLTVIAAFVLAGLMNETVSRGGALPFQW